MLDLRALTSHREGAETARRSRDWSRPSLLRRWGRKGETAKAEKGRLGHSCPQALLGEGLFMHPG